MSTQTSKALLALLLLAGCSPPANESGADTPHVPAQAGSEATPDPRIWCRTAGEPEFHPVCSAEQKGTILTVRDAKGGFRRFRLVSDGRGLVAADGAAEARVTILSPREIAVAVDGHIYKLPARMAAGVE